MFASAATAPPPLAAATVAARDARRVSHRVHAA